MLIIMLAVAAAAAVGIAVLYAALPEPGHDVVADIVMPSKASRPGCEEAGLCYVPSAFAITRGQTVTWVNEDSAFHSVTSGSYMEPDGLFDSGYMDPHDAFSFRFDDAGVYGYYCTLHPWMAAKITVQ